MERSKTIHIININHFLENSKLAQHLLEVNKQKEPNMEFKIWTEDDPEIQEGIKNCKYKLAHTGMTQLAGIYLPNYILYKFGGVYCEMDYEFLQENYFYNLYKSGCDLVLDNIHWGCTTISNSGVHYFPYPENDILKNNLLLLNNNSFDDDNHHTECDYLSIERALKLKLYNKNDIEKIKESFYSVSTYNVLIHYSLLLTTETIYICNLKKFESSYNFFKNLKNIKVIIYKNINDNSQINYKLINNWNFQYLDLKYINRYIYTIRNFTDKKLIIL